MGNSIPASPRANSPRNASPRTNSPRSFKSKNRCSFKSAVAGFLFCLGIFLYVGILLYSRKLVLAKDPIPLDFFWTPSHTVSARWEEKFGPLNVIVLYPDDMRYDSLEDERGPDYVKTPFLTSLARNGIRFTHNAVTTSICWISRATLFTGQYASRHGSNQLYCPRFTLEEYWKDTWPARLQQFKGYFVGHVGKWHYWKHKGGERMFNWSSFFEGQHWEKQFKRGYVHAADLAAEKAVKFLQIRPKDRPFALTVAIYPPKAVGVSQEPGAQFQPKNSTKKLYENITYERPYNIQEAVDALPKNLKFRIFRGRYGQRWNTSEQYQESMKNYHALITEVDEACRQIVEEVKRQGLWNTTMIIFSSDNGLLMGAHGLAGKWNPMEESIRVPLIIYDPRMPKRKRGRLDDSRTLNIDLAETILGAAQLSPAANMQGRDISDLYLFKEGKNPLKDKPWRDEFYYNFPDIDPGIFPSEALVGKRWKYIFYPKDEGFEQLFDLKNDPYELNDLLVRNISSDVEEILQGMRQRFRKLRDEYAEPDKPMQKDWCNETTWKTEKLYKDLI